MKMFATHSRGDFTEKKKTVFSTVICLVQQWGNECEDISSDSPNSETDQNNLR
jgi:hypothetical protein